MKNETEQNQKAVQAFETFMAYISNELFILNLANNNGFFNREIELLEKIKQSGINYSSIYKES